MTRKEALEYINNMWMSGETHDALEVLIPEFGESEDEKIRKLLVWQVHRNIEDETNDLAQSVYDGIKGHDPDIEESIEDWKRCLAWLEKQKEPLPIPDKFSGLNSLLLQYFQSAVKRNDDTEIESDTDLWGRKILDYVWKHDEKQKEQKPIKVGENAYFDPNTDMWFIKKEQKPVEWSEEDEDMLNSCISSIEEAKENRYAYRETDGDTSYDHEISWLKSLRPQYHGDVTMTEAYKMGLEAGKASSWKPSEEQMKALEAATVRYQSTGLESLFEELKKLM